jgi:predicted nucleotidyltransferase
MSIQSLRSLARVLNVPERTLRRAAAEGLVHGRRVSDRRYETTLREEMYLRGHWPLLRTLRAALRTEPNVRLAVLFGSVATGRESERSDVDVLAVLRDETAGAVAALAQRLSDRAGREVQLVRLQEAQRAPSLMADALAQGRVLIDRDEAWPALKATEPRWKRKAAAFERPLDDALPDLDLELS